MNKKIRILILMVPVLIATAILLSPLPTTPDDDLFFSSPMTTVVFGPGTACSKSPQTERSTLPK